MIAPLLAAWALVPLFGYGRYVLDDTRLDGGLMAIVAAVLLGFSLRGRKEAPETQAWRWLGIGFGIGALGLLWSGRPWPELVGGLADRAAWAAAGVALWVAVVSPRSLERAWLPIWIAGSATAWVALVQMLGLDLLGLKVAADAPPTGFFSNRPQAAEYWTVLICAVLASTAVRRPLQLALLLAPAALMAGYLDSTAARLALPLGLAWLYVRMRRGAAETGAIPQAWLAGVLALFVVGETVRMVAPPPFATLEVEKGEAGVEPGASTRGRAVLYGAALKHAATHPLGLGIGRFENDYPEWRPLEEQRMSHANYQNIAHRRPKTPHSEPLLLLLELGWLGFAAVAFGLWRWLVHPNRATWTNGALIVLAVHALVRSPFSDHGPLLALSMLLLAARRPGGAATGPAAADESFGSGKRAGLRSVPGAIWVLALIALVPAPAQLVGELSVAQRLPLDEKQPPSVLGRAIDWRPWDARAQGLYSVDLAATGTATYLEVRQPLLDAVKHDPANLFALNELFRLDWIAGATDVALQWIAAAEIYSPEHPAIRENRTRLARETAEFHRNQGLTLLKSSAPTAHEHLKLAGLWKAMQKIREGDQEEAAKALRAAAVYAQGDRGTVERVARAEELTEGLVRSLLERLVPEGELALLPRLAPFAGVESSDDV